MLAHEMVMGKGEFLDNMEEFIKWFNEQSGYIIIHENEYGEYEPEVHYLEDIYKEYLSCK